jgi:hypothetical protein
MNTNQSPSQAAIAAAKEIFKQKNLLAESNARIIDRHMQSERDETRKALELAKATIDELMGVSGRMHNVSECTDSGCAYNVAYRKGTEAITAINQILNPTDSSTEKTG